MREDIQKVIIDFDDTLFDAYAFKRELCAAVVRLGFSEEEFWTTYKQTRDHMPGMLSYTFARHAENLISFHPTSTEASVIQKAFEEIIDHQDFIFSDARPLLDFLKSQKKTLILLSLGDTVFQSRKVENSGLVRFFDRIELVDTRKLDVIQLLVDGHEPVYFLNDKALETKEILECYPHWQALLRERADHSLSHYVESGLPYFKDLSDMQAYLMAHK